MTSLLRRLYNRLPWIRRRWQRDVMAGRVSINDYRRAMYGATEAE